MNNNNFKILIKAKELNKYLRKDLENIVKSERFLRTRILNTSYDLIEIIILTNTLNEEKRKDNLHIMFTKLSMINYYLEILNENNLISKKKLLLRLDLLNDIKNMIYAWIRVT